MRDVQLVLSDEPFGNHVMKSLRFREGQGFAYKTGQALPQSVAPPFHMIGFTCLLPNGQMAFFGQDVLPGFPNIGIRQTLPIFPRHPVPEPPTGLVASGTKGKGHNLPGAPTHDRP